MKHIVVVSLGPGDPGLLTVAADRQLRKGCPLILRTDHHPAAEYLRQSGVLFSSLDDYYERYDDFDEMYNAMADHLWKTTDSETTFAVQDASSDRCVQELKKTRPADAELTILPGVSLADTCLSYVSADESGIRILPAYSALSEFYDPSEPTLITELDNAILAGDIKLWISTCREDDSQILFFPSFVAPEFRPAGIQLDELDRQKHFDHTTCVYIPATSFLDRNVFTVHDLERIMDKLRGRNGCPWDSVQTHESLKPYLVEEAWESVNAIDEGDPERIADELGDVLFQVIFHASLGKDCGEFTLNDIAGYICRKMIVRHPHVFGSGPKTDTETISDNWEALKRSETGARSVGESMNDVSTSLPSLKYAAKVCKKTASIPGWNKDPHVLYDRIREYVAALPDVPDESSASRLLFMLTDLLRMMGADAEISLHLEVDRFKKCFQKMEALIAEDQKSPDLLTNNELDVYLRRAGNVTE